MKKHFLFYLLLFILIDGTFANELPKFAVISDTHAGRYDADRKVRRALRNITDEANALDAIFVVGDLTNDGKQDQYTLLKKIFDEEVTVKSIPTYYCMGNHDRYNDLGSSQTMFETTLNQALNQYVIVKGYPFILLSMENKESTGGYATYSKTFLEEKLKDAAENYPDKPIFVFMHVPVDGTVYGSFEIGGKDSWGSADLKSVCEKYPQIIVFSGHSHYPLGDERSIHQDKFTSVNDGNVSYCEVENGFSSGTRPQDNEEVNEGCLVSIEASGDVIIKRLNFAQNVEIASPWTIKAPHDGTAFTYKNRDGGEQPEFAAKDEVVLTKIADTSCEFTFPQATDDDKVQRYNVEVLDKNGTVVKTEAIFSLYYLNALMPATMSVKISLLEPETTYSVRITALDCFGNASVPPLLSEQFTTLEREKKELATILDVSFRPTETIDISASKFAIGTNEEHEPTVFFDKRLGMYAASFSKADNLEYYCVDYKGNTTFKENLYAGFAMEVLTRAKSSGAAMSSVSSQESGGFGLEQTGTGDKTEFWFRSGGVYKKVGTKGAYTSENTEYQHMIFTFDGKKIAAYFNGAFDNEVTLSDGLDLSANEKAHWIAIGGDASVYSYVQSPFDGDIALVRMYNQSIDATEVARLYQEIQHRKALNKIGDLNTLLTETIPTSELSDKLKEGLLEEGYAMMDDMKTSDDDIQIFVNKVNKSIVNPSKSLWNINLDGSFDNWETVNGILLPKGWYGTTYSGLKTTLTPVANRHGEEKKACKITSTFTGATDHWYSWHLAAATVDNASNGTLNVLDIAKDTDFYYTFWAKADVAGLKMHIGLPQMYDPNHGALGWDNMPYVVLTTEWKQYGILQKSNYDAKTFSIQLRGNKTLYIDDIMLEEGKEFDLENPTSLTEMQSEGISVYSRNGIVYINADVAKTISVYGIDGRKVVEKQLLEGENTIAGLTKGIYLIGKNKIAIR